MQIQLINRLGNGFIANSNAQIQVDLPEIFGWPRFQSVLRSEASHRDSQRSSLLSVRRLRISMDLESETFGVEKGKKAKLELLDLNNYFKFII